MKVLEGFDISKYITSQDVVAAVTAGTIAYLTYKTKQDEPAPEQPQGQTTQTAQSEPTGMSATHRSLRTTNPNDHMIAGFDEEGYMHDCDMMIGNKRVLAVLDKEGNVTSWLDKNGNPFKFANPEQQSRYEYFMKQVAGVNGKQPTFNGSLEEFLAQSNPSGGAAGASVAASITDDQWVNEFEKVIYGKGFVVQGGSAGKQVAAKLCKNLITSTNITDQELQTLLNNPAAIRAMVRNYGSFIYTSDKDIGKYTRYFMTFMRQGMSLEDAAAKAGRLGGIRFS